MSITLDPTAPADAESPRQGASRIRSLTLQLLQLFSQGGGAGVTFSAAPFSVDTAGNVTIPVTLTVPTPTATGHAAPKSYVDAKKLTSLMPHGVASGTNTYVATLSPVPASLSDLNGVPISVQFTNGNTAVSTLNTNGLGAIAIRRPNSPIQVGDIVSQQYYLLIYDGSVFELQEPSAVDASTPFPSINTTLLTTTIASGANADILQVTATPPANPQATQKYRALCSFVVYYKSHSASSSNLACVITDNGSVFSTVNVPGVQGRSDGTNDLEGLTGSFLSSGTRTNAQGAVIFKIHGYAALVQADLQANSDAGATALSMISIAWIPAQ